MLCVISGALLLWGNGIYTFPPWLEEFFGMLLLVAFPEAFINGMAVTAFVVFKPEWLETLITVATYKHLGKTVQISSSTIKQH